MRTSTGDEALRDLLSRVQRKMDAFDDERAAAWAGLRAEPDQEAPAPWPNTATLTGYLMS